MRSRTSDLSPSADPRRASFTLVEVLAALALAALLVSITGQMAIQGLEARRSAVRSVETWRRQAVVFESLAADFAAILPAQGEVSVSLFGTPQQVLQLQALALVEGGPSLHLARRPATVRYRLLKSGSDGAELVREITDQAAANSSTIRETLARQVAAFEVAVLVKGQWVSQWVAGDRAAEARAIRVSVTWGDQTTQRRTFLLGMQGS